jgi:ectoine hydroxylase-related dioxygenase (phytanoyl-CoA dioxygenase family)
MVPKIDAKMHESMNRDGFVVLEDVFTVGEMQVLAQRLEDLERRMHAELVASGGSSGISRADEITFNDHLAEKDDVVREFCLRPEFVEITTAFLGPNVDLYWNQTVFKHPEGHKEFPWHQDDGYTPVLPSPYLTLWLAINDATPENGCVSVLPGSHRGGLVEHKPSPIGLVCRSNDDPDQGIQVPVRAGSIVAFWSLTMHRSGPNRSQGVRRAYVIQYCQAGLKYAESGETVPGLMPVARDGKPV